MSVLGRSPDPLTSTLTAQQNERQTDSDCPGAWWTKTGWLCSRSRRPHPLPQTKQSPTGIIHKTLLFSETRRASYLLKEQDIWYHNMQYLHQHCFFLAAAEITFVFNSITPCPFYPPSVIPLALSPSPHFPSFPSSYNQPPPPPPPFQLLFRERWACVLLQRVKLCSTTQHWYWGRSHFSARQLSCSSQLWRYNRL